MCRCLSQERAAELLHSTVDQMNLGMLHKLGSDPSISFEHDNSLLPTPHCEVRTACARTSVVSHENRVLWFRDDIEHPVRAHDAPVKLTVLSVSTNSHLFVTTQPPFKATDPSREESCMGSRPTSPKSLFQTSYTQHSYSKALSMSSLRPMKIPRRHSVKACWPLQQQQSFQIL